MRLGARLFQTAGRAHVVGKPQPVALRTKIASNFAAKAAEHAHESSNKALHPSRRSLPLCIAFLFHGFHNAARAGTAVVEVISGEPGERTIMKTASGIKYSELREGKGELPRSGDLVVADVVGRLDDGTVFLDTRSEGRPLLFQLGTTSLSVTEGLAQMVEGMKRGSVRLAVVPPSMGYGEDGAKLSTAYPRVPGNAVLYYEIELLRCQTLPIGLACCSDAKFPCAPDAPGFSPNGGVG